MSVAPGPTFPPPPGMVWISRVLAAGRTGRTHSVVLRMGLPGWLGSRPAWAVAWALLGSRPAQSQPHIHSQPQPQPATASQSRPQPQNLLKCHPEKPHSAKANMQCKTKRAFKEY